MQKLLAAGVLLLASWFGIAAPRPTATVTGTPHVLIVLLENRGYQKTLGNCSADPYLCSLAASYASFTAWDGVTHPSLPNYLGLTSGSTQGCTSDNCKGPYTGDLGAQLTTSGIPWTAYMESMKTACSAKNANPYTFHHNPFAYYTDDACATADLPYPGASGLVSVLDGATPPAFVWITPNQNDDMHNGSIAQGDQWLQANLAPVLSSAWFTTGNATVIVSMDEGDPGCCNQVPMVVISTNALGAGQISAAGTHYETLGAIETVYGLPLLGSATNLPALTGLYG